MAQLCTRCSRANPSEAVYCYFDGFVLGEHERRDGPVAVGAQPFSHPFVFPTGRTCRSFDELALACQEEWSTACGLLKDGYLASFLGGLGRLDLALAAKEAARFPDVERGLDQLLTTLPTDVLAVPRLRVEPLDVNLGTLEGNQERSFDLELENQGMRLLVGTATSAAVWLTLGEAGAREKHFHFTHEARIPIHIRSERVRAGSKPLEAKLLLESNGGAATVTVRVEKPVRPFPEGTLQGAKTPRQVAERAQAHPKEVAPLFESGAVAAWYAGNGWTYPVKIPVASGPAAIQQFFEALGLTRPPRVDVSHRELSLQGSPGATVPVCIEVRTQEKRPVFAHVTSNVPWLEVSRARFNGRTVAVPMTIPTVPDRPGETLTGQLTVIANGNQRFLVPVRLEILGEQGKEVHEPLALPAAEAPAEKKAPSPPASFPSIRRRRQRVPVWVHSIPAVLLGLALLGVAAFDLGSPSVGNGEAGVTALPTVAGPNYDPRQLASPQPRLGVDFNADARFGVVLLDRDDPHNKGKAKRLTFCQDGASNNTIVKIGSSEYRFGFQTAQNIFRRPKVRDLPPPYKGTGWESTMDFKEEKIRVTQYLQIVPSQTGLLDTLLIYYDVRNYGTLPQNVAVRILLDTFIGDNDGVPFTASGSRGFVTTQADYRDGKVPDYLEAVEKPDDPTHPGTIARIGLHGLQWSDRINLLEPDRVRICKFPGSEMGWDWPGEDMSGDSCVVVYWPEQKILPRERRDMALTYGLGNLNITGQLALSAPATAARNREFTVTAYVYAAVKGQEVAVELPDGVELTEGERTIPITEDAKRTQVFWKVKATREGPALFGATAGGVRAAPITVQIQAKSIFG